MVVLSVVKAEFCGVPGLVKDPSSVNVSNKKSSRERLPAVDGGALAVGGGDGNGPEGTPVPDGNGKLVRFPGLAVGIAAPPVVGTSVEFPITDGDRVRLLDPVVGALVGTGTGAMVVLVGGAVGNEGAREGTSVSFPSEGVAVGTATGLAKTFRSCGSSA